MGMNEMISLPWVPYLDSTIVFKPIANFLEALKFDPMPKSLTLVLLLALLACQPPVQYPDPLGVKVNGLVFTGPGRGPLTNDMFSSMAAVNANFVAVVPEASVYRQNLRVNYDFENQWFGERKQATLDGIRLARANGLKVMLKPHLDIAWDMSGWERPELDIQDSLSRIQYSISAREFIGQQENRIDAEGHWRGGFMTKTEEDWNTFEKAYTDYILDYAQLADSLNVELFCIGTEMKRTALEKPDFWRRLIIKVKEVYSGPLTYAANWDSYDQISFWNDLDYIGVDAYFPLSDEKDPSHSQLKAGWKPYVQKLEALAKQYRKPVLLTEWGYENEDYVGKEPWVMGRVQNTLSAPNDAAQVRAYESMFESLWNESWIQGVFVWHWADYKGTPRGPNYSPRDREAGEVLKREFGK